LDREDRTEGSKSEDLPRHYNYSQLSGIEAWM